MILWRVLNNSLPLRSELGKRGIHCNPLCPRCNSKIESMEHVFMTCPKTTKIWFGSQLNLRITNQPITSFQEWLSHSILNNSEEVLIQIAGIVYYIWFSRNLSIYEDKDLPEDEVIQRAERSIRDYQMARTGTDSTRINDITAPSTQQRSSNSGCWAPPESGWVKANCDANLQQHGWWGLGTMIRDSVGQAMAAAAWKLKGFEDATLAEAHALLTTVRFAADCGFRRVCFEGDNEKVFHLIHNGKLDNISYLGSILKEIQTMQWRFDAWQFHYISRKCNQTAHAMAQLAHLHPNEVWLEEVPPQISEVYCHDLIH